MRKLSVLLIAVLLLAVLCFPVSAATTASDVTSHCTVSRDSGCQVTMTATLHLDQVQKDLVFPVPAEATGVTVNGARVRTTRSGGARLINLDRVVGKVAGDFSLSITYGLPDVIHLNEDGALQMQIPMLAGFSYPIETMEFSVTLPGEITTLPAFESGYHKSNIERDIVYQVDGATISGAFNAELKDHETVTMKLLVDDEMFPQTLADAQDYGFGLVAMGICAGVAFLYWLIFLRFIPWRRDHCTEPVQGCTAGEVGCVLNTQGVDLHLTVLSWAQMGYLTVTTDRNANAVLHKRMDMGNERKEAEQRLFQKLFAKRDTVDTRSYSYAMLARSAARKPMGVKELIRSRSGNPKVFRAIASVMGLFGGICLAIAISGGAVLQGLMILILGALGTLTGWYVQGWAGKLMTHRRKETLQPLAVCGIWILVGLISGAVHVSLWMSAGLLTAGLLLAWGGLRTDLGKQTVAQMLGLRRYLCTADKKMLQQLCQQDPEYFFELVLYAMAMGVESRFARRFGGIRLENCPYLSSGPESGMSASEWLGQLKRTTERMAYRQRRLATEQLIGFIQRFIK